jgi:hypothetical protein
MAKEAKTVTVSPCNEQSSMDEHRVFGWDVLNNQVVNQDELRITYQRDPASVKNYEEIAALDKEYFSLVALDLDSRSRLSSKPSLIVFAVGIICFLLCIGIINTGTGLFWVLFGLGIIALRIFLHIRKNNQWDIDTADYKKKCGEILEKTKQLHN